MKTLLKVLCLIIASAPMAEAQTQLRQVSPKAIQTRGVPGRYRMLITMSLKSYSEVQIMRFTKTDVTFTHQEGMETISLDDMPPEVRQACNYVPPSTPAASAVTAGSPNPEQLENVRRSEVRRYIKIVAEEGDSLLCQVWGIGGSKDPQVSALRKAGRKLQQYKNEFLFPLNSTDRFAPGYEDAVVKGLKWTNKGETEMVLSLYLVKKGGVAQPSIYATSLTEAAKWVTEK
jgi:hypothetical protein